MALNRRENKMKEKAVVTIKNLNVRSTPEYVDGNIVGTCEPKEYNVLDKRNGFIKIGNNRWVDSKYAETFVEQQEEPSKVEEGDE